MQYKYIFLFFIWLFPLYFTNAYAETDCNEQVTGSAFDWDDNVMYMPTQVILYNKKSNETIKISTNEFAIYGSNIGIDSKYKDYEIRKNDIENSFKYFDEDKNNVHNYFLNDIKKTVNNTEQQWKGPAWDKFIHALNNEKLAKWTVILTARGHSTKTIYEGLQYLQSKGMIKYLPKLNNIYAVSHPKYENQAHSAAVKKTKIIEKILDHINSCDMSHILDQNNSHENPTHTWVFSDDDIKNINTAKQTIGNNIASGRWSNIKISLLFTGNQKSNANSQSIIIF